MLLHSLDEAKVYNDLVWAIQSPPLITSPPSDQSKGVITPDEQWYSSQLLPDQSIASTVIHKMENQKDFRLGKYFEVLIQAWLNWHQDYEIIAGNLQVNDDKRTVGEFDLLILDRKRNKTMHWEIAVKFYLADRTPVDYANCHGPGRNDRFDKKLQRLFSHQLKLNSTKAGKKALNSRNIVIDEHWAIFKGKLFYPSTHPKLFPEQLLWYLYDDFKENFKNQHNHWQILPKAHWLTAGSLPLCSTNEVCEAFVQGLEQPLCLLHQHSKKPLFLVRNNWGTDDFVEPPYSKC